MGPGPMTSLRDELFRIAGEGSEEQMRKFLQDPEVNVNEKHTYSLVALHQSAEFNLDIGVTKVQSSMQKPKLDSGLASRRGEIRKQIAILYMTESFVCQKHFVVRKHFVSEEEVWNLSCLTVRLTPLSLFSLISFVPRHCWIILVST